MMQSPPVDPPVDDLAPTAAILTGYDERHLVAPFHAPSVNMRIPRSTCPSVDG